MSELRRSLGVADAVVIGAGSMLGAGVFAVWGPAAEAAGPWLLLGLAIAGAVAFCNATSSAQLAARHPESGGTYVYAREEIGPFWGHVAGWGFVVGKTASCAAMALTVGAYAAPEHQRLVANLAVLVVFGVNVGGLTRTVRVTRWLLVATATTLAAVVVSGVSAPREAIAWSEPDLSIPGVLRSAGLIFFAFAGYARIATLGEEVRDPHRTIPRAVPRALALVLAIYALVALVVVVTVPAATLPGDPAPLRSVIESGTLSALGPLVPAGAAIACAGVLLNLLPGVSRTVLAMARRRELPSTLSVVDGRRAIPLRAEVTVVAVVLILVNTIDLRSSIAVSGVAVLTYYAITNASALAMPREARIWHPSIAVLGLTGCVALVLSLPVEALIGGGVTLLAGVLARAITRPGDD
ncbi:MAG: APC family permease [Actinomycetota bacterium]|nr:APC family permease [Actinomycetota bacterium]